MKAITLASVVAVVALSGCGGMAGLNAKDSFSCKAPDGVLCESMSGVYANGKAGNLPGQRIHHGEGTPEAAPAKRVEAGSGVMTKPIYSGTPIRSAPLVLRVWFAPWEDTDGDLHDQSYVYLPVDSGKWLIEHNRRRIRDAYRPVRAPASAQAPTVGSSAAIKVTPPVVTPDEEGTPRPVPQTPQEMMNGILRPGMPGVPAEPADNP